MKSLALAALLAAAISTAAGAQGFAPWQVQSDQLQRDHQRDQMQAERDRQDADQHRQDQFQRDSERIVRDATDTARYNRGGYSFGR
jgi:opacity protein-like surface antigen